MLGGLLSAHIIATDESDILGVRLDTDGEYGGELLRLARELGHRLLPAFEASPSGIPFARVSLELDCCRRTRLPDQKPGQLAKN
ncbi:ER degradation-enhancing alpha-mannosidase-like protein 2, partial [Coemansia sp. RSA 2706]